MHLDNPALHSLNESHQHLALAMDGFRFYQPDYCPFGGSIDSQQTALGIEQYAALCPSFYVIGTKPASSSKAVLQQELVCKQMLLEKPINIEYSETIVPLKSAEQQADLLALVNLVQPGYFKAKTAALGNYYGIYKEGQLIAVSGERMQMNAYTEVSAIVTHPDHTGKGYARQLTAHASNAIFQAGKIPFLHVVESNARAIQLYEQLGFKTRRHMSFWHFHSLLIR